MSLFVTGTDTEVGKTLVSAVLLARYAASYDVGYWKPVATGFDAEADEPSDRDTIRALVGDEVPILDESYRFAPPVSPHLAARLADTIIEPDRLLADWRHHRAAGRPLVVEGIGGVLVPFDDRGTLVVDLIAAMRLPCLLVARSTLGTINHSLLSLEALRARGVPVVGVVMSGPPNDENRAAVQQLGDIDLMLDLPTLDPIDATTVAAAARAFDPAGALARHFVS